MSKRFLYFAYGSNLKSKRVKINSPSAKFVGWAVLNNYRLAFAGKSKVPLFEGRRGEKVFILWKFKLVIFKNWNGAVATIISDPDDHVIGCLWSIENSDQRKLDRQEGVHRKIYEPIEESW